MSRSRFISKLCGPLGSVEEELLELVCLFGGVGIYLVLVTTDYTRMGKERITFGKTKLPICHNEYTVQDINIGPTLQNTQL